MGITKEVKIKIESKHGKLIVLPYYECNGLTAVVTETTDPKVSSESHIGIQFWKSEHIEAGTQKTPYGGISKMISTVSEYNAI